MCYFYSHPVVAVHELSEENAITAYKVLTIRTHPVWNIDKACFWSPYMHCAWDENLELHNIYGKPGKGQRADSGIYCFIKKIAARVSFNSIADPYYVVAELKVWGRVVEHSEKTYSPAGYRAQHARIVRVYTNNPGARDYIKRNFRKLSMRKL